MSPLRNALHLTKFPVIYVNNLEMLDDNTRKVNKMELHGYLLATHQEVIRQ
ncbi:unnamed protein product [Trichobilharzia regenti]|nr:unnamed protein product [Trichobilharzia regenti]